MDMFLQSLHLSSTTYFFFPSSSFPTLPLSSLLSLSTHPLSFPPFSFPSPLLSSSLHVTEQALLAEYERDMHLDEEALCAAIQSLSTDDVVCPVCQR